MADRADAYAQWLVANKAKAGTPEFETVASAYKQMRAAPQSQGQPDSWQVGSKRTPVTAPNVTGNQTVDAILEPVTGFRGRMDQAFNSANAMAEHGAKAMSRGDMTGLAGFLPGIAGVAAAPISAALEPAMRPINEYVSPVLEKTFGTPPELSTPILSSLIPGMGVTKVPVPKATPLSGMTLPAPKVKVSETPTAQELRSKASRSFKEAEDAGVVYSGRAVDRLRENALADLEELGFDEDLHPRVKAVLKRLNVRSDANPDGNLTLKGSEIIRRVAMNAAKSPEKQERLLAWKVIDRIGEFVHTDNPADVLMGDAKKGAQALADARNIWARMSKSELIDLAIETAFTRAKRTGSGANLDNTVRQNVSKILGKDNKPRGFSADEIAALKEISEGTTLRNALRLVGKAAPTGVVSGGFTLGSVGVAGLPGLLVPVVGFLSKIAGDKLTVARARELSGDIRSGDRNGNQAPRVGAPRRAPGRTGGPALLTDESQRQ